MKKIFRMLIRKILFINEKETIIDGVSRHKYHLYRKFYLKRHSIDELDRLLNELEIKSTDILFVQSSWRSFVGFDNTPKEVAELLLSKVKNEGMVLMPSLGNSKTHLNIENDKTVLGAISEEFRKLNNSHRSIDSYFPICANGVNVVDFLNSHEKSVNPFDENSPFRYVVENEGKFMFLGMGRYPYKVSFVHHFMYENTKLNKNFSEIFYKESKCCIETKDKVIEKKILIRGDEFSNNNKLIKKTMKNVKHKHGKIGFLDVYVCTSSDLVESFEKESQNNKSYYKKNNRDYSIG